MHDLETAEWLSSYLDNNGNSDHYLSTLAHAAYMATPVDTPANVLYRLIADGYSIWEDE